MNNKMNLDSSDLITPHPASEDADIPDYLSLTDQKLLEIQQSANYRENWSIIFYNRLICPETIKKYIEAKLDRVVCENEMEFASEKLGYLALVDHVFQHTKIMKATDAGLESVHGGIGSQGDQATVFVDGSKPDGTPFSVFQKSIVEAHEQAHGVLNNIAKKHAKSLLKSMQDSYLTQMRQNYLQDSVIAEEILARITQLKNYFGFFGGEPFTQSHLDYARKHIIEDVGTDNSIGTMLKSIDDDSRFIAIMNILPC